MDELPPPVDYHFPLNGFKHATSSHIYDWVNEVDNLREIRVAKLGKDYAQDIITPAQKKWVKKQREIRGIKFPDGSVNLADASEIEIIKHRLTTFV